jgi:hypothetical protein
VFFGGRGLGCHLGKDPVQYRVYVGQDVVVPETQHPKTVLLQERGADSVGGDGLHVLPAINLDDRAAFDTTEVDHIWSHRMLAAELNPTDLASTKVGPQRPLGVGLPST